MGVVAGFNVRKGRRGRAPGGMTVADVIDRRRPGAQDAVQELAAVLDVDVLGGDVVAFVVDVVFSELGWWEGVIRGAEHNWCIARRKTGWLTGFRVRKSRERIKHRSNCWPITKSIFGPGDGA